MRPTASANRLRCGLGSLSLIAGETFTPYYQPLIPCINKLRRRVFPRGGRWRDPNPKLYDEMREILRAARHDLEGSDSPGDVARSSNQHEWFSYIQTITTFGTTDCIATFNSFRDTRQCYEAIGNRRNGPQKQSPELCELKSSHEEGLYSGPVLGAILPSAAPISRVAMPIPS
ncbi:serine threonine-protein kinase sgk2 [Paraphaeosphaeria minitans]|uniref:Serine threonine-protein kinase sgk2 n=1 Tax=Paraphaeosphaeria minitans TaxID=565426 RepID=A0A9P6KL98_9PLEO|nr:serine threonine-protein kinase sgk2 [Paraphaeosphaeria minitans]